MIPKESISKVIHGSDNVTHEVKLGIYPASESFTYQGPSVKPRSELERLNEELRRREKCIRISPDEKSCLRLFGAILQGFSEDWISGKLYLSEPMEKITEAMKKPVPFEATRDGLEPCSVGYASSTGLQPVAAR